MSNTVYVLAAAALIAFAGFTFRVQVRREYRRFQRLSWLAATLETLVFSFWSILAWIDVTSTGAAARVPEILQIPGWTLLVSGLVSTLALITWFRWLRAMGRRVDELIRHGPYAYSRNPQLVACFVAILGAVCIWPSWHMLGWLFVFAIVSHMMVLTEEEHLRRVFGNAYRDYTNNVPRYVGKRRDLAENHRAASGPEYGGESLGEKEENVARKS